MKVLKGFIWGFLSGVGLLLIVMYFTADKVGVGSDNTGISYFFYNRSKDTVYIPFEDGRYFEGDLPYLRRGDQLIYYIKPRSEVLFDKEDAIGEIAQYNLNDLDPYLDSLEIKIRDTVQHISLQDTTHYEVSSANKDQLTYTYIFKKQ